MSDKDFQVSVLTTDICVEDLSQTGNASDNMRALALGIEERVNYLLNQGAMKLTIIWREIPPGASRAGTLGFFIVSGKINERKNNG